MMPLRPKIEKLSHGIPQKLLFVILSVALLFIIILRVFKNMI